MKVRIRVRKNKPHFHENGLIVDHVNELPHSLPEFFRFISRFGRFTIHAPGERISLCEKDPENWTILFLNE